MKKTVSRIVTLMASLYNGGKPSDKYSLKLAVELYESIDPYWHTDAGTEVVKVCKILLSK